MTSTLGVATVQRALDALISGDEAAATGQFTGDVVLTGVGGCLDGIITGLPELLGRFADMSRLTQGTFGTEVEAVYRGKTTPFAVVTRHWASLDGEEIRATQVFLATAQGGRIRAIDVLSGGGPASGIWD